MENKNIIIILVAIVVVLAAVLGVMFLQSVNVKEPTKLKITSDKTQYGGGKLSIQLTDQNKTAISKEKINVIITNKKGNVVLNKTVNTNSKGKANLELDLGKGKYNVTVTFGGNENYTGSNATQKLTVKEEVKETVSDSSSSKGWTTVSPGGDAGSSIVTYHDGEGHMYVTRYSSDGSAYEDGIAYEEGTPITS